jgi:integrase
VLAPATSTSSETVALQPIPERIGWWWVRARELSQLDRRWRLHDLRHFAASMAGIAAGHDVRSVAGRLGHANPAMTLRVYAHAVQGGDARIAEDLGRMLPLQRDRDGTFDLDAGAQS